MARKAPVSGQSSKFRLGLEMPLGLASALLLVAMTLLTCVDVIARYWFNAPVNGAFELTQMMLAGLIFAALPMTTALGEHVDVDIFSTLLGARAQNFFRIIGQGISALVLFVLAWRLWAHGARLATDGAVSNSLELPLAPIGYFAAVSCALSGVVALIRLIQAPRAEKGERVG